MTIYNESTSTSIAFAHSGLEATPILVPDSFGVIGIAVAVNLGRHPSESISFSQVARPSIHNESVSNSISLVDAIYQPDVIPVFEFLESFGFTDAAGFAGGSLYNISVSQSLVFSDAAYRTYIENIVESIALSELAARIHTASDEINFDANPALPPFTRAEAVATKWGNESFGLSEAVTVARDPARSGDDSLGFDQYVLVDIDGPGYAPIIAGVD